LSVKALKFIQSPTITRARLLLARGEISVSAKISGVSTSEPLAPPKGSNTGSVVADRSQNEASAAAAATAQTGDHVTLTDSARALQKLSDAIAQVPVVNSTKVAAIKQALSSGTYKVDSASVATKLLQFEGGMK